MRMDLTPNEKQIIEILRETKPFEKVEISKDRTGKYDEYIVHRSQKVVLASSST